MDFMELLRRMQAPAVDTETGYYDTYQPDNMNYIYGSSTGKEQRGPYIIGSSTGEVQKLPYRSPLIFGTSRDRRPLPKVKQVITETDNEQPNKSVTTIEYPQGLMESEEKIPMDKLYTDTLMNRQFMPGDTGIYGLSSISPSFPPTMENPLGTPFDAIGNIAEAVVPSLTNAIGVGRIDNADAGPALGFLDKVGRGMVDAVVPTAGSKADIVPYEREFEPSPGDTGYIPNSSYLNNLPGPSGRPRPELGIQAPSGVQDPTISSVLAPQDERVLAPVKPDVQQIEERPILKEMYGRYAYDPKARKEQYLNEISKIYRNAILLNAIAQFTGGKSQAAMYVKMATDKLDAIEKFDQEERLQNIWKGVYFDGEGNYRDPGSWDKAFELATILGAGPEEASEMASVGYDKPDRDKVAKDNRTPLEKKIEYLRRSGFTEKQIQEAIAIDAGLKPKATTSRDSQTTIQKKVEYAIAAGAITPEEGQLAIRYDMLGGKPGADRGFSARGEMLKLYLEQNTTMSGRFVAEEPFDVWFAKPENQRVYEVLLSGGDIGQPMITNMERLD